MEEKRLIAFGCSFTYGHGLPDCITFNNGPGSKPSKFSWPNIVAKQLGLTLVNKSSPGASNKKIWHEVLNFDFKENDTVFILWSYNDRYAIIKKHNIIDIGPWLSEHCFYKNMYDENDSVLMSKLFVNHANKFLDEKRIKVYNLIVERDKNEILTFCDKTVNFIPIYIKVIEKSYPKANDKLHPGLEAHMIFGKRILDFLGVENEIEEVEVQHSKIQYIKQYLSILKNKIS